MGGFFKIFNKIRMSEISSMRYTIEVKEENKKKKRKEGGIEEVEKEKRKVREEVNL